MSEILKQALARRQINNRQTDLAVGERKIEAGNRRCLSEHLKNGQSSATGEIYLLVDAEPALRCIFKGREELMQILAKTSCLDEQTSFWF